MDQSAQNTQSTEQDQAQKYTPPNKLSKKQQEYWVDKVTKDYASSSTYTETYFKGMWSDMRKLYNSERVLVGYNGISDTFVPMSYSTVEALVASTAGDKPMVEYVPTKPEQATNTDVLNHLFSYYWDLDGWTLKTIQHSRGLFKLGSSVMYGYWDIDHPCINNVPIDDWFCDPTTTFFNYQKAGYMGHRFLVKKSALEQETIIDPVTGEVVPKYMNLKKLGDRNDEDETSKEAEDTHRGSVLDKEAQEDEIEGIVYYTLDDYVIIGNRQEVIYYDTNPFKARQQFLGRENPTGMYPYMFDAFTPDENQLFGRSVLQPILKPQELLNDMTNQNVDAVTWGLDPEMELDPIYSDYLDKMGDSSAGNVYPFKPGSYKPVGKNPIPNSAFNERTNIKNEIREATAIDELIKGSITSQRTTATEAKIQTAQAGKRFDLAVAALENGGYYQMAKLVYQLIQHYVTEPVMFRVVGKDGVDWKTFDPNQFQGDYEPRVKLKVTIENEKDLKTRDVKELYTALLGSPYIDQQELERLVLTKGYNLEPDEATLLLKKPDQLAQDAQSEGGKQQGKPPAELINYKDAPPDVQAQMEQAAGFQPSATHDNNMQSHLLESMAGHQAALDTIHTAITPDSAHPIPQAAPGAQQKGGELNPAGMFNSGKGISG